MSRRFATSFTRIATRVSLLCTPPTCMSSLLKPRALTCMSSLLKPRALTRTPRTCMSSHIVIGDTSNQEVANGPHNSLIIEEKLPDGKPKRMGRILEDMLELLNDKNLDETLDFVNLYAQTMNSHHVYRCFGNIHRHLLLPTDGRTTVQHLRTDERFGQLCVLAGKKATYFGPKHCVYMVRNLHQLGFNSDSVLMQSYVEMCRYHINDLTLTYLALLGKELLKMAPTSQIELLLRGLSLAVENNYHRELRYLTSDTLIDLFQVFGSRVGKDLLNSMIWNLKLRKDSFRFNKPDIVLKTLSDVDIFDRDLMEICCKLSLVYLDRRLFHAEQMMNLMRALSHFKWYSHSIYYSLVDYISQANYDWQTDAELVHLMMTSGFYPTTLVANLLTKLSKLDDKAIIEDRIHQILQKIVDDSEAVEEIDSEKIRCFSNPSDLEIYEFAADNFISGLVLKSKSLSDSFHHERPVMTFVVQTDDYFRNLCRLRGRQYRALRKLRSEGEKICLVSAPYWWSLAEHERFDKLERSLKEAEREGYSQLL